MSEQTPRVEPEDSPGWMQQARRMWRSESATSHNMHLRDVRAEEDRSRTREVVDLVMRIAELALSTGASASETTAMVLRMCDSMGVRVQVDINNTSVVVSQPGGAHHDPITSMRTVKARRTDYSRLSRLEGLVHKISKGRLTIAEARGVFNDIIVAPRTYRRWVLIAAAALMGGAIAVLLGGMGLEVLLSTLSAGLVDAVLRILGRWSVPQFFANVVGAAMPTLVAVLTTALWPDSFGAPTASIIVGAGIVSMLAGLNLVSAARDALDGYYITSGARIYEAVLMTSAIVVGVTATIWLGLRLGVSTHLSTASRGDVPLLLQVLCAGTIGLTFAIGCHAGPRTVALSGALAVLTQLAGWAALHVTDYRPATTGFAALVASALATWSAPRWRVPVVALISAGIISQVPGSLIYRGLYAALQHDANAAVGQDAGSLLATALLIGIALAIGANLGTLAARPFALPADGTARAALVKSWRRGTRQEQ